MNIAEKNDYLRKKIPLLPPPHRFIMTAGFQEMALEDVSEILRKLKEFKNFEEGNDPYGEHDFVAVEHKGEKYFLKIDCLDKDLEHHKKDGIRVMTLMNAREY